jgi:hypothetical protein
MKKYKRTSQVSNWGPSDDWIEPYPLLISTGFLKYPLELKKKIQLELKKKYQL